jgi:putative oxidoreductase
MATAISHVHGSKGPWSTDGGWEYNAVLIAATLAVVEDECGLGWALAAGAAGVAGSFATTKLAQQQAEPEQEFEGVPFQAAAPAQEPARA